MTISSIFRESISRRRLLQTVGVGASGLLLTGIERGGPYAQAAEPQALPKATTHIKGKSWFYRVAQIGDKWTFLTPEDRPLYLRGLNHVQGLGGSPKMKPKR